MPATFKVFPRLEPCQALRGFFRSPDKEPKTTRERQARRVRGKRESPCVIATEDRLRSSRSAIRRARSYPFRRDFIRNIPTILHSFSADEMHREIAWERGAQPRLAPIIEPSALPPLVLLCVKEVRYRPRPQADSPPLAKRETLSAEKPLLPRTNLHQKIHNNHLPRTSRAGQQRPCALNKLSIPRQPRQAFPR